jgi:hypothetical protein
MAPESWVALGMVFTGLGIAVGGSAGVILPAGHRLGALVALIAGFGVGVSVLAFGTVVKGYEHSLFLFFVAGLLGFFAVCVGVWLVVRSSRRT